MTKKLQLMARSLTCNVLMRVKSCDVVLWDVTNTNDMVGAWFILSIFTNSIFGRFQKRACAISKRVWLEGYGKSIQMNMLWLKWFEYTGVYVYHCHIIEHEDGMAQIESYDPIKDLLMWIWILWCIRMKTTLNQKICAWGMGSYEKWAWRCKAKF